MNQRYKLILSNNEIYREISLPIDREEISIGTQENNDIRLFRDNFGGEFRLSLRNQEGCWQLMCDPDHYLRTDKIQKMMFLELRHGQTCTLVESKGGQAPLNLLMVIDFNYEVKDYDRVLDLKGIERFTIGSGIECNIVLSGEYIPMIEVVNLGGELQLNIVKSDYGMCHNGNPITGSSRILNKDFFSVLGYSFYYTDDRLYITAGDKVLVQGIESEEITDSKSAFTYPHFNRNTRLEIEIPEKNLEILDPPVKPGKPDDNLILHLIPALLMLAVIIIVRGVMAESSMASYLIFSVCSMSIGILTSVFSYIHRRNQYKKGLEKREKDYKAYIERKKEELVNARRQEAEMLNKRYIDSSHILSDIEEFSGNLFDRNTSSPDFLKIRMGHGNYRAAWEIHYTKREKIEPDDELTVIPHQLSLEYENLENVPVICDLKEAGNIGVVGDFESMYGAFKTMLLDLCAHHYYDDLQLFFAFEEKRSGRLDWIRYLPHVKGDGLFARNIICNEESKTYQFERIYKELCRREGLSKNVPGDHIIIFLIDDLGIKSHPISKYFQNSGSLNVHFISFEEKKEMLPMYCGSIIEMTGPGQGILTSSKDANQALNFSMTQIGDEEMLKAARKLAPVYCDEISLESSLTKNITLFELLDIFSVTELRLERRWKSGDITKSMAAPLGVKSKDEIVCLDLHEKADGPHGLVAGTTGSGKSELMQSYILSMATLFSPYDVAFVIIDFKGGGMANQFRELPHLAGAITDIDGKEINRSLLSIRAELDRRKELFARAGVNNIESYIRKYKKNEISSPLPHLIIIVDEFAELKADQPEFMKELISTSRIGRSLGVHLILATQKPAGQVSDQIWSNSRFKICLKVQTREDSNEVIRSPLAAEILEPGRAYLQVGNNEKFELFQSAYSGASEKHNKDLVKGSDFVISELDLPGRRRVVFEQKMKLDNEINVTQLDALVNYIHNYCFDHGIAKLPPICLPSLPQILEYPALTDLVTQESAIKVPVGIYDAPQRQLQDQLTLGITGQNTIIIGSSQYGKTNLLMCILRGLAQNYTPQEVNIYVLDFASMIFGNYEDLNHVGGVVFSYEEEKCRNLFRLMEEEINTRKEKLAQAGVSSYAAYREAGFDDLAQIVLLIDNLTVMRELYLLENDFLLPVCREGAVLGISVIVANAQTSGIGYKYLAHFDQRICFTCNDTSEYNTVFNHCRMSPSALPGRCLVEIEKEIYEAQTYLAFSGKTEYDRVQQIKAFVDRCSEDNAGYKAVPIPHVPDLLTQEYMSRNYQSRPDADSFCLGLSFKTVAPIAIDWIEQSVLAISGSHKKNRDRFLSYMMNTLTGSEANLYILDDYKGVFENIADADSVSLYSRSLEDLPEIMADIRSELADRYSGREVSGMKAVYDMKPLVFLIQNQEAVNYISSDRKLMDEYKTITGRYRGLKCCIIFTDLPNEQIAFSAPEVLKQMRDNRQFLVFEDLSSVKLFETPTNLLRKYRAPLENDEAYLLLNNELSKIKIIDPDQ